MSLMALNEIVQLFEHVNTYCNTLCTAFILTPKNWHACFHYFSYDFTAETKTSKLTIKATNMSCIDSIDTINTMHYTARWSIITLLL